jgi:hypothetical protein
LFLTAIASAFSADEHHEFLAPRYPSVNQVPLEEKILQQVELVSLEAFGLERKIQVSVDRLGQGTQVLLLRVGGIFAILRVVERGRLPLGAELTVFDAIGR